MADWGPNGFGLGWEGLGSGWVELWADNGPQPGKFFFENWKKIFKIAYYILIKKISPLNKVSTYHISFWNENGPGLGFDWAIDPDRALTGPFQYPLRHSPVRPLTETRSLSSRGPVGQPSWGLDGLPCQSPIRTATYDRKWLIMASSCRGIITNVVRFLGINCVHHTENVKFYTTQGC